MYKVRVKAPGGRWTRWHDWSSTPTALLIAESMGEPFDGSQTYEPSGARGVKNPRSRKAAVVIRKDKKVVETRKLVTQ